MKMKTALLTALTFALSALLLALPARAADVLGAPPFVDYQGTVFDGNC